jgi:hypothetical protein
LQFGCVFRKRCLPDTKKPPERGQKARTRQPFQPPGHGLSVQKVWNRKERGDKGELQFYAAFAGAKNAGQGQNTTHTKIQSR